MRHNLPECTCGGLDVKIGNVHTPDCQRYVSKLKCQFCGSTNQDIIGHTRLSDGTDVELCLDCYKKNCDQGLIAILNDRREE